MNQVQFNLNTMQKITRLGLLILFLAVASSCGNREKKGGSLSSKKAELEKLKAENSKLDDKITGLEKDIAKLDTSAGAGEKAKLVSLATIDTQAFKHYLQLQGTVDNKNVSYVTSSGQGGQIKAIYVKQGDHVKKGQLILKLDNDVAMQSVAAVKQQMGGVQAQLDLAKSVYQRQKNLWDQHIGTEVQLLQDKTTVEALENQLKAIQANVNTAQATANQSNVYSDVNGDVDEVTAHIGEAFNGNPLTGGYVKIVNNADLKVTVTVPENYAGKVSKGSTVEVDMPDIAKSFNGAISFLSQTIGTNSRGFTAEIKVPSNLRLRPNQVALVKILDYSVPSTVVVNVNTLQTDENGKFVLVAVKEGDKLIARKRKVDVGELSGDQIEIKKGLKAGEQLITEGYQSIYDGQLLTTTAS
ncbi:MAG: efflux RND transporter periplasmic adaptor subunit [Bacteroidota bacterium]|nr:efflux RND transporter periplasmic adaptor subunit [Bacteroidota bacterium]